MNPTGNQILVGVFRDVAWVRVRGKGTSLISPDLRRFAEYVLKQGQDRIIVDLQDCRSMDSTFMGTLTNIAKMLKGRPSATFQVIGAGERNLGLLQTLGLDQVFQVDVDGSAWQNERSLVEQNVNKELAHTELDPSEKRQFILEAHQALCEANRENIPLFQDVLKYLSKRHEPDAMAR